MAKIPSYKDIQQQNLGPDAPEWTKWLLVPLNQFFRLVFSALDRRLTLVDNFDIQEFTTKVIGGEGFVIPLTLKHPAKLVFINQVFPVDFTGAVSPVWQQVTFQGKQVIQIIEITGLNVGQTYNASFIIL